MSIRMMFKRCIHCGQRYTYNPSVGDFGMFCKQCGRVQMMTPVPVWEKNKHGSAGNGKRGA